MVILILVTRYIYIKSPTHIGTSLKARFKGPTWAHLGPTGPRWAACWPHELCYLGSDLFYRHAVFVKHENIIMLISHSSGLDHETMACAICLTIFLCRCCTFFRYIIYVNAQSLRQCCLKYSNDWNGANAIQVYITLNSTWFWPYC